jgi:serine/threonine protein kinase
VSIAIGRVVGPYEVVAKLGEGGMGEVYRARDTRLNRDVALKVLPSAVATDPDRLARFRREAQFLASLNHPNVAQVYGVEDANGAPVMVLELVEGQTLEAVIGRPPHALPVDDALAIARQVADALEAAHEAGVVHRDLKPANIKVRADGVVKVLDFGLAKAVQGDGSGLRPQDPSPFQSTMTSPAMTAMGVILGTAAYMSPEQAKGKPVDKRADIWAFGVVLYEMLAGARLFHGETVSEMLASVIKDDVRLDRLPAAVPAHVRRLLARCLERDARLRLRDIGEARVALSCPPDLAVSPLPAASRNRRSAWATAAAGVILSVVVGLVVWRMRPVIQVPIRRFELPSTIAVGAGSRLAVTLPASSGVATTLPAIALSPDGTRIAYVADGMLRARAFDALDARDLTAVNPSTENVFWSPDGRTVGFTADAAIHTIPVDGGPVFTVCKVPATGRVLAAKWRSDGAILFSVWRDSLYAVPAMGGNAKVAVAIDPAHDVDFHDISILPDGRLFLETHGHDAAGVDLTRLEIANGAERKTIPGAEALAQTSVGDVAYAAPGVLVVVRRDANAGVWSMPFDVDRFDLSRAVLVQAGANAFNFAGDGTLLVRLPGVVNDVLTWVDRSGKGTPVAGTPFALARSDRGLAISPDGQRVALAIASTDGSSSIVVRDLDTGVDRRLTFDSSNKSGPSWFPSGDRLVYTANGSVGDRKIVWRAVNGRGAETPLVDGAAAMVSPDGRELLYLVDDRGNRFLRRAPIGANGVLGPAVAVFHDPEPDIADFDLSPDGRLLAYAAREPTLKLAVSLTDFPGASGRWQVEAGGNMPRFSHDGRELFYVRGTRTTAGIQKGQLMVATVASQPSVTIGAGKVLFDLTGGSTFDISADGQRFLMTRPVAAETDRQRLVLIQNWLALLPAR